MSYKAVNGLNYSAGGHIWQALFTRISSEAKKTIPSTYEINSTILHLVSRARRQNTPGH